MRCKILHESENRLRVHFCINRISFEDADLLECCLKDMDFVTNVKIYEKTADAAICYSGSRDCLIKALSRLSMDEIRKGYALPEHSSRALNAQFYDRLVLTVLKRAASKLFIPMNMRFAITAVKSLKYIRNGLAALMHGRISVEVLDGTAVAVSVLRGSYETAGSVMFMLSLGEILEDWTHKKSIDDLAKTMSLNVDKVWLKSGEAEVLVPVKSVKEGDLVVVRMGHVIPLDGKVHSGTGMVNQASITGEPLAVAKEAGSMVYAGTVMEEGSCVIEVGKALGRGRYDRIVKMIEESERLKSAAESRALGLADGLVPYTLAGTALVYLLTRNVTKALSVLMVDFSCALKLSMPIAVLSAMREGGLYGLSIKGGKYLEAVARADTVVFDKTGTLTHASPKVWKVVTFSGYDENEMLRLAACLEEHYPHSLANAVVLEAKERNLHHEEKHGDVQYVVAHGISSCIDGQKVVIGSAHFVFEDEGCIVPPDEQEKFDSLPADCSHLYMAVSGRLVGVICISDPLRAEAPRVIAALKRKGMRVVMMTGDSERCASSVAGHVSVDEYYSEVLPEDKAGFIVKAKARGHIVMMIGDGINDSPALSNADVGVAVNTGAAIAREVADVTVSSDDLELLITLRRLSERLMWRIRRNYRFILSFNLGLIVCGISGIIMPATSAFLHNASTLYISVRSMANLLDE